MFTIDPRKETSIYKAWRTRAGKLLANMFCDIRENDANTHWLIENILQALNEYWDSPEHRVKQVKARGSKGLAWGGSLHTGGSTTIEGSRLRIVNIILYTYLVI